MVASALYLVLVLLLNTRAGHARDLRNEQYAELLSNKPINPENIQQLINKHNTNSELLLKNSPKPRHGIKSRAFVSNSSSVSHNISEETSDILHRLLEDPHAIKPSNYSSEINPGSKGHIQKEVSSRTFNFVRKSEVFQWEEQIHHTNFPNKNYEERKLVIPESHNIPVSNRTESNVKHICFIGGDKEPLIIVVEVDDETLDPCTHQQTESKTIPEGSTIIMNTSVDSDNANSEAITHRMLVITEPHTTPSIPTLKMFKPQPRFTEDNSSENNENIVKSSENNENIVKSNENNENIVKSSENNENIVKPSENNENIVKSSENNDKLVKSSENDEKLVKSSENNGKLLNSRENNEKIEMSRMENNEKSVTSSADYENVVTSTENIIDDIVSTTTDNNENIVTTESTSESSDSFTTTWDPVSEQSTTTDFPDEFESSTMWTSGWTESSSDSPSTPPVPDTTVDENWDYDDNEVPTDDVIQVGKNAAKDRAVHGKKSNILGSLTTKVPFKTDTVSDREKLNQFPSFNTNDIFEIGGEFKALISLSKFSKLKPGNSLVETEIKLKSDYKEPAK